MALTRDERRVLDAARTEALRRSAAEKTRLRQIERFDRLRKRAENGFKRGMTDRLLAAAGLNAREIERRVAADRADVLAFMRSREAEARRDTQSVRRRQRAYAKEYLARAGRAHSLLAPGSPRLTDVLYTASDIRVDVDAARWAATSIAAGKNIGRVLLFHDQRAPLFQFSVGSWRFAQVVWTFLWSPPRDGQLAVAAFLLVNGWRQVWCESGCLTGASAGATLAVQLAVTQGRFNGPPFTDTSAAVELFDTTTKRSADESTGQIDIGRLDLQWVATLDRAFVVEGPRPVAVTVNLLLQVHCSNAQSTLDLFEKQREANVPGMILTLD